MKRITKIFIITLIFFIGTLTTVHAKTVYNGKLYEVWHPDSGFTVFAEESNGWMDYNSWMIKSTIDDRVYYCIDPSLPLEGAEKNSHAFTYNYSEIISEAFFTTETYKKVNLLAFYGYGYKEGNIDHTDKKWYGITQVMIWRIMRPDLTWTFKKTRNSTPDKNLYKQEINEMNELLNNHYIRPSFAETSKTKLRILLGQETTFHDNNGVLSKFVESNHNTLLSMKINGNDLTILGNKNVTDTMASFKLKSRISNDFALFTSDEYQDIILLGEPVNNTWLFDVEVTGGILKIQKIDSITEKIQPQGEASFKEAVFEIFDSSEKSVGKVTTDEKGKGQISLEYGVYTIKEIKAPKGYKLSTKEYKIEISESNNQINLNFPNKVITGKIKLEKTKGGAGEGFTIEEGATFDVLDSNGEVVEELKTNEKGLAITALPYGEYTIHQTKGDDGYIFVDDFKVNLKEDKIYEIDLKNLKLSKLELTKLDDITNKPITNTMFEIYKQNQIIEEEPKDELIDIITTDSRGIAELKNLSIGRYYIVEKTAPKKYKINKEKTYFDVKENGKIVKITIKNKRKEGSLKFLKTNESGTKRLQGAKIDIYFTEANKLAYRGITNKKGEININLSLGKYCLYEKEAPKGYKKIKNKICFNISEENEIINITMKNQKKETILIPKTLKNKNYLIFLIGLILTAVGVMYILNEKKTKY